MELFVALEGHTMRISFEEISPVLGKVQLYMMKDSFNSHIVMPIHF